MKIKNLLFCKEKFQSICVKDKKYRKVRDNCHDIKKSRGAAHRMCNLKYSVPKKNPYTFSKCV